MPTVWQESLRQARQENPTAKFAEISGLASIIHKAKSQEPIPKKRVTGKKAPRGEKICVKWAYPTEQNKKKPRPPSLQEEGGFEAKLMSVPKMM